VARVAPEPVFRRYVFLALWLTASSAGWPLRKAALPAAEPAADSPAVGSGPLEDFDDTAPYPATPALEKLLARVPGEPYELSGTRKRERPISRIAGLMRLSAAWAAGSALRFSILEPSQLQLHVWNGSRGVTWRYYPEFHQTWAAYGTTREGSKPRPAAQVLWATSGDRYRRSGPGTVELACRDGRLALVRGDLTLASVPFEGLPTEVYFEGAGLVRGLALVGSTWAPEPVPPRPAALGGNPPASLTWKTELPKGASFKRLPDGRVELEVVENGQVGQATIPLGGPGPCEILVEVEDADAGTGVFVADEEGKHLGRLGFFRHRETGKTAFDYLPPWSADTEKSYELAKQPLPLAGARHWFRLVVGCGLMRCFTSGDGSWWSQPAPTSAPWEGTCTRFGLYGLPAKAARSIKLRSIEVRRLEALASCAPEAVRRRVDPALAKCSSLDQWRKKVADSRPAEASAETWWRACAVRTLGEWPRSGLNQVLLDRLQQEVLAGGGDGDLLMGFMEQTSLFYPPEDWSSMDRLAANAQRLGRALACRGQPAPLTTLRRAMMRWPVWHHRPLPVFSEVLLRHELVALAGANRWDDLRALCRRLRYANPARRPRDGEQPPWSEHAEYLLNWAENLAARHGPPRDGGQAAPGPAPIVTDPLQDRISKEGFTTISELRAALASRSYRDACQIIVATAGGEKLGLLPDGADPRLSTSFPLAIESALRDDPALRQAVEEQFGRVGQLRLNQATAAGDAAAVAAVAAQFAGSGLASAAHRWLGDRALVGGQFAEAARHYRQAIGDAAAADRDTLRARARLTGALVGRDVGEPVQGPVQLGKTGLSAAEFEQMVRQLRQGRQGSAVGGGSGPAVLPLPPGRYETRPWAQLEPRDVKRPPNLPERGLDWAGRLTGVLVAGSQMVVNNRIEQVALDVGSGRQQWVQRSAADDNHLRWPLEPLEPLGLKGRILARRLTNSGPELVCLEGADGQVRWTFRPDDGVVADPLVAEERLLVLAADHGAGSTLLYLFGLHPDTGSVRSRTLVAEFRDLWRKQFPCRAALVDDRIVATAGGCVVCCDTAGRVHWLRRQVWVPPPGFEYHDARPWLDAVHPVPLATGDCVLVTQPGVWEIECVDVGSGRARWREPIGGLARVVGILNRRLIVQTDEGLMALAVDSGKVLWFREVKEPLDVRLASPPDAVVYVRRDKKDGNSPAELVLAWLDAATGRPLGRWAMKAPRQAEFWLEPLVSSGNRTWAFVATVGEPAKREVLELVRVGDLPKDDLSDGYPP